MDTNTVIVVIANAPEYDDETVIEALREARSGRHGEFLQELVAALLAELVETQNAAP